MGLVLAYYVMSSPGSGYGLSRLTSSNQPPWKGVSLTQHTMYVCHGRMQTSMLYVLEYELYIVIVNSRGPNESGWRDRRPRQQSRKEIDGRLVAHNLK